MNKNERELQIILENINTEKEDAEFFNNSNEYDCAMYSFEKIIEYSNNALEIIKKIKEEKGEK